MRMCLTEWGLDLLSFERTFLESLLSNLVRKFNNDVVICLRRYPYIKTLRVTGVLRHSAKLSAFDDGIRPRSHPSRIALPVHLQYWQRQIASSLPAPHDERAQRVLNWTECIVFNSFCPHSISLNCVYLQWAGELVYPYLAELLM